jgi:NAD(P)H-dependent flavin oxidoreductase YrpB (nitropropane dioxygenase family)
MAFEKEGPGSLLIAALLMMTVERRLAMLKTRFTELVGCSVPIQQAGLGVLATPRLAAAVADAGGLGMVSLSGGTPEEIAQYLDDTRKQTSGVIGANFVIAYFNPSTARECVAAAAPRVKVVDFFYGDPDPLLVEEAHSGGALASWQVGSREEAVAAQEAGCDFIIAQGVEAGGHVRGHIGLLPLLSEVLESVQVPVLAAGGIGSGRAMAAVLASGAEGVRVGTRFVASEEAEAHPDYVKALIAAEAKDSVYTDIFSVGWPGAPHRVLGSSIEAAKAFEGEVIARRYWPEEDEWEDIHRFESKSANKNVEGGVEAMPLWAGEGVGSVKKVQPAAGIVRELVEEAEKLLRRWC